MYRKGKNLETEMLAFWSQKTTKNFKIRPFPKFNYARQAVQKHYRRNFFSPKLEMFFILACCVKTAHKI
jgi:hypothetical protein